MLNKPSPVRVLLVTTAFAVTVLWLCTLFAFPERWKDSHGYNPVGWLVITSGLHLVLGIFLGVASIFRFVSSRFALVVGLAPIGHLAGSPFEMPWCIVLFVAPSAGILIAAYFELCNSQSKVAVGPDSDHSA
jgi:hypothetical protein